MLSLLHIEDIAVISQAEIAFGEGFNVLTGETGAGKSIVVDAIGAIIGGRTSRDLIRTGAKCARVTGVFGGLPALNWFEQYGIAPDENGELLVERVIHPDGKNTCRVNGHPVLVTQLRELGSQLLNIHGQHDGQQLLDEETHLESLDNFAHLAPQRQNYTAAYERVKDLRSQLKAVQMDEGEKARRMDTLQHQIGELERAQLRVGEEAELTAQREILRNAERITDAVDQAWQALTGGEMSDGAVALLTSAENALTQGGRYSAELSELAQKVSQLRYAADDVAELVRDARSGLDFYPGQLDDVEERLDLLHRLKRKYGADEEEMLAYLDRCQTELDNIQFSDERREKLEREVAQAVQAAQQEAEQLSKARQKAAKELSRRIQQELSDLDMPRVRFEVEFGPVEGEDGLNEFGMDRVRFLMSANLGEDLKPINRIASGGELSRIMLALKNVLAETDCVTTMVFDEVDTGVSGRAATKVAQKLSQVARGRQVLCVTHLPQIAAMGDVHFSVEKGERDGRTYTRVEQLDRPHRREELARLSGGASTAILLEGAEELLQKAEAWKQTQA